MASQKHCGVKKKISLVRLFQFVEKPNLNQEPVKFIGINKKGSLTIPNKNNAAFQNWDLLLEIDICKMHINISASKLDTIRFSSPK